MARAPTTWRPTVLATSQRGLDVARERIELVGPLGTGDDPRHAPAGRMFLMAARRADPRFELAPGDIDALGQICRRLDVFRSRSSWPRHGCG